ncbi:MAG: amidase [Chloroflexota bacterium]
MTEHSRDDGILGRPLSRKTLLKMGAAAAIAPTLGGLPTPSEAARAHGGSSDLEELSIAQMQSMMQSKQMSARELVGMYLDRFERIDKSGPTINAIIETNPDALAIADALDRERASGHVRGPLHGIPIVVKDNIGTADKMQTAAGSLALVGHPAPYDAFVAHKLRQAGAIIFGKSNLSEWANFRSTRSTSGWSGRGGQTRNPYVLDRDPSGSSSGSAAAVAANLAAGSLGSETDGSIVSPASINGVVGLKPTLGLTSRAGVVPLSHSQDVVGPICRTVADAAAVLSAIAGYDPHDPVTRGSAGHPHDYTRYLSRNGVRGARLGIVRKSGFGNSGKEDLVVERAIHELRRMGATIVDPVDYPGSTALSAGADEFNVLLYDFKHDINHYLRNRGNTVNVHSLKDLIHFNHNHHTQELRYFNQDIFFMAQAKGPLTTPEYQTALANDIKNSRQQGIDYMMNQHHLDALVVPTNAPAWPIDLVDGDHFLDGSSTLAAVAGYPAITVPAGYTFELPIGITFFGRAYSEPRLIRIASGFEYQTKVRHAPRFLPTTP